MNQLKKIFFLLLRVQILNEPPSIFFFGTHPLNSPFYFLPALLLTLMDLEVLERISLHY